MFVLNAIILYTTIFDLNHAESIHNSFCVTGSIISTHIGGTYEFNNTNSIGNIYYNKDHNLYLFPWNISSTVKHYLIGENTSKHQAHSFSTFKLDPSTSLPYTFIEEDFLTNWQSYAQINNNPPEWIDDPSMRLVNCNPVCIHAITYEWSYYNVSSERSVYISKSNNAYLYRSNINKNTEKWERYINHQETLFSQFSAEVSMHPCIEPEIFSENTNTTDYYIKKETQVINTNNALSNRNLLIIIIAASVGFIVMIISIVIIIKKCVCNNREAYAKDNGTKSQIKHKSERKVSVLSVPSNTNTRKSTLSRTNSRKESKLKLELDDIIRKRTMSTVNENEYGFSSDDDDNIFDLRKRTISASGRSIRSNKPPPIGMKPILTAKQQESRPLPPTPTSPDDHTLSEGAPTPTL